MNTVSSTLAAIAVAALAPATICQATYGNGTPGTGNISPALNCPQAWLGNPGFGLQVDDGLGAAPCIVLSSIFPSNLNAFGMTILADPSAALGSYFFVLGGSPGVAGAGAGMLPLSLANVQSPAFAGLEFYFQAFVLDPQGPGAGGGLSASNGLAAEFTMPRELAVASNSTWFGIAPDGTGMASPAPFTLVNGIAFDNAGRDAFVTTNGTLWHGDLRAATPVWTAINTSLGTTVAAWGNLTIQNETGLGWLGGRGTGTQMELLAVDLDAGSPTVGQTVYQTTGLQAAIQPFGAWAMSPDQRLAAAASPWNGSLAIVDIDPNSSTFLQILITSAIPSSVSAPGFTVNNYLGWSPDGLRVYIARQNQSSNPGEVAVYDLATGWVDHDPSTTFLVEHIGADSVPPVPLPIGLRALAVAPDGAALYVAGSGLGQGFAGRIDLPSLGWTYASGTMPLSTVGHLAITPDGDAMALAVPGQIGIYDTSTMTQTAGYTLGSGINIGDLAWR